MPAKFIRDILVEHYEELAFLWNQRRKMLTSRKHFPRNLRDVEERMEAHVEGLLIGEDETVQIVSEGLQGPTSEQAFAVVHTLIRLGRPQDLELLWDTFLKSAGPVLEGMTQALTFRCPETLQPRLAKLAETDRTLRGVAAMEVLATHWPDHLQQHGLEEALRAEDPKIRCNAWRPVVASKIKLPVPVYQQALTDEEPSVRRECLWAAAWSRQPWLLDHCRQAAEMDPPDGDAIEMLCVLGESRDLPQILRATSDVKLGPRRLEWLGAYGHPGVVETILAAMQSEDPKEAEAAGDAFTQITGVDVSSGIRGPEPALGANNLVEFEEAFSAEYQLPDSAKAREVWANSHSKFRGGSRWCLGFDLGATSEKPNLDVFDLRSCTQMRLRGEPVSG